MQAVLHMLVAEVWHCKQEFPEVKKPAPFEQAAGQAVLVLMAQMVHTFLVFR